MPDQVDWQRVSLESKGRKSNFYSQWNWTTPRQHSKQPRNEEIRQCSITIGGYAVLHIKTAFTSMWCLEAFSDEGLVLKWKIKAKI